MSVRVIFSLANGRSVEVSPAETWCSYYHRSDLKSKRPTRITVLTYTVLVQMWPPIVKIYITVYVSRLAKKSKILKYGFFQGCKRFGSLEKILRYQVSCPTTSKVWIQSHYISLL